MKTVTTRTLMGIGLVVGGMVTMGALPCLGQQITGQWDFDNGDLSATVGAAAQYWHVDPQPPPRDVQAETQFGTTTSFGISDIGGQPANVMSFPQTDPTMGYAMYPEIDANGGGAYVNQFTLIMDILYPSSSSGVYRSLLQTNTCNDSGNDGDMFLNASNQLGISGDYAGTVPPDAWSRVTLAFDLAAAGGPVVSKYIDGVLVEAQVLDEGVDGRWSLYTKTDNLPTLLFTDNDGETAAGYVNSIQIRDYTMSDADVATLGPASAGGIPGGTGVTGQWDFDNGDLRATVGRSLLYFKGCQTTCPQVLEADTQFGLASSFGLPPINKRDPRVMSFPLVQFCNGYSFPHGAAANGGGAYVNDYTLIMDVIYPSIPANGWAALYQTNTDNTNDADWFIDGSDHSLGIGSYGGLVADGVWHRLALVADLEHGTLTSYINGVQAVQLGGQDLDGRFALDPTVLLFTDNNGETSAGFVNSVQFRDYAMSAADVAALGGPTAAGIGFQDPPLAPDVNGDGFVDATDYAAFVACWTGPNVPIAPANEFACTNFDTDGDNDIDQIVFGVFQQVYSGSAPCAPNCYYP